MTIKRRLVLSNIAMIIIPVVSFFLIEIIMGFVLFYLFKSDLNDRNMELFLSLRFISLLIILILTNGLLTYFVARSIIRPVDKLTYAAKQISDGNLNYRIDKTGKDELGQLSETFETMRRKLKEAEELQYRYEENRKELIASISHDLKTPMTSIKGYVNGIRDGVANTPEKIDRYMETIYAKANDMDRLIDELFLYSKLDLHQVPFHYETINLQLYLSDFVEELAFDLDENGELDFSYDSSKSYFVRADQEKLRRVLTNIIQNSLKYMDKEQKRIQVSLLDEDTSQVTVRIDDNGSGIQEDAIPFIFDRFYRTDTSRNSTTGGSGLGLAIAKRIIEEQGGKIWAESKIGIGTSVYFTLPKASEKS
ncbi:sensor histidine kinase [Oceanobacillus limi]|uniref:sensor histidine kinase n=1 Tax=Oceanobacillus limi TaxID=930131 RepID=UPI000B80A538|nr:HAMP domain-containing sensor histidine kinase [Oceanobacillus limi]